MPYKDTEVRLEYHRAYYRRHKKRMDLQARKWRRKNADYLREYDKDRNRKRLSDPAFKAKAAARMRRYLAGGGRMTPQHSARVAVRAAVKCGLLKRLPCSVCGSPEVQGHHYKGYALENWFDVQWLCKTHHDQVHRNTAASAHSQSGHGTSAVQAVDLKAVAYDPTA